MSNIDYNDLVLESMHELRYFNQQLKNLAEQLCINLSASNTGQNKKIEMNAEHADNVRNLAENIANLSQLFTTRIDFIDVELNPDAIQHLPIQEVNIYGKFDKAKKMLHALSRKKRVKVKMTADTNDRRVIQAYSIIDILPYLLLDNAIKYAPERSSIEIEFTYYDDCVKIQISSEGPFVGADEIKKLSLKHYRGRNAIKKSDCVGRGLGLYFVGYIADLHDISISYESAKYSYELDKVPYSNFNVSLSVPFQ
ncbi:K+-sensing histidine kinase KdpD [Aeromonas veronii]|uniref:sensor histidine kinase n=1 Tax=Aeromonas veronii TaxID=654 RepID=UPI00160F2A06|nr:ATP-binding protein [Aeromonas veronii]MCS3833284.1 K+-sensing histidine kinase KdpD [Aeromonas veronii]